MPDTQPTPRDEIRVPLGLAWALLGRPIAELDGLLDEYETAHRNEALAEAAELALASETGHRLCVTDAAERILNARTTTAQEQP